MNIFLNPISDSVHISMPNNTEQTTTSELHTLNGSALNHGVYMIQLQFKDVNKIKTFKIIKK
ncbi:hypothetical protein [Psychroserpens damuponensis]|uniref:hypothetical protein n=1 Tax=Psychroserpens damuponensis TaxID=943936 RepID=UPI0005902A6E|nr:hypothetical protein [Psychroserpens damuponensis]